MTILKHLARKILERELVDLQQAIILQKALSDKRKEQLEKKKQQIYELQKRIYPVTMEHLSNKHQL